MQEERASTLPGLVWVKEVGYCPRWRLLPPAPPFRRLLATRALVTKYADGYAVTLCRAGGDWETLPARFSAVPQARAAAERALRV